MILQQRIAFSMSTTPVPPVAKSSSGWFSGQDACLSSYLLISCMLRTAANTKFHKLSGKHGVISSTFNNVRSGALDLVPGIILGSMCTDKALLQEAEDALNAGLYVDGNPVRVGKMHIVVSGSLPHQVPFDTQSPSLNSSMFLEPGYWHSHR